jgi:phosphate transport system substrate-binding protein
MKPVLRLLAAVALLAVTACGQPSSSISGAGATFPYPIYAKWADAYQAESGVGLNYQSIGSGGGIRQVTNQTVFFGATDGPMTPDQMLAAPSKLLHFPTVLGAVVPVFNLPGMKDLKFSGPVLADIFLGKVTKWNDNAIARLNPGVNLPGTDITVVHRSDGSGTSYIWVDYLAKVSPEWKSKVGIATSVNWPTGVGGKGNEGVAGLVSQTPGSLGYVELIYALQNKIAYGSVQNMVGDFVQATVDSVTAAAAAAANVMPDDFRVSITNAPGKGVYPISSFTWLLVRKQNPYTTKGGLLRDFILWMLQPEAQEMAAKLHYASLPPPVVALVKKRILS